MKVLLFCMIVFLIVVQKASASPFVYVHMSPALEEHNGYVVTKENDTIRGLVTLGQCKGFKKGVGIKQGAAKKFVYNIDILKIRIYAADTSVVNTLYTDFVTIGKAPWRVVARDKIDVYDNQWYTDERRGYLGDEVAIVVDGKIVSSFNFWGFRKKNDLVSFVNKHCHKQFKPGNFPSAKAAITYLAANG